MTRLIGLAGVLTISWSGVFVVLADVTPATAAFFRALYAIPVLLVLWLLTRDRDERIKIDYLNPLNCVSNHQVNN